MTVQGEINRATVNKVSCLSTHGRLPFLRKEVFKFTINISWLPFPASLVTDRSAHGSKACFSGASTDPFKNLCELGVDLGAWLHNVLDKHITATIEAE